MALFTEYEITLGLKGPFLTKSSSPGGYGLDAVVARNHAGKPCIAGSHVTGKLRESLLLLKGINGFDPDIKNLFGDKSGAEGPSENGDYAPIRKRLVLSDFILEGDAEGEFLYRIRIDKETGAAKEGAYQVIESPFTVGKTFEFKGHARFFVDSKNQQKDKDVEKYLRKGLEFITQFGGHRTIGFGRLDSVKVALKNGRSRRAAASSKELSGRFGLAIELKEPFCVNSKNPAGNIFESDDVIPGGMIKGAVTTLWQELTGHRNKKNGIDDNFDPERQALCLNFSEIQFSHAFPSQSCGNRPIVPPMSLVSAGGELYDVAMCKEPGLISGKAPAFFLDWKKDAFEKRDGIFPPNRPARELRVRTAMDSNNRRSKEKELFSYEMVIPDGFSWYATVDMSGINGAQQKYNAESQLRSIIEDGPFFIGKTKALAEVSVIESAIIKSNADPIQITLGKLDEVGWIITLQTSAIMLDPQGLGETTGMAELEVAYQTAWGQISGQSLKLVRYFARQRMAGGKYLAGRFIDRNSYKPFILTEPGSVFVLKATNGNLGGNAQNKIESWMKTGLTLPGFAVNYTWENCPYVPENGYGEIAVNLPCADNLAPREEYSAIDGWIK